MREDTRLREALRMHLTSAAKCAAHGYKCNCGCKQARERAVVDCNQAILACKAALGESNMEALLDRYRREWLTK